jgi:Spy/CpxP family protein refolding chaperone
MTRYKMFEDRRKQTRKRICSFATGIVFMFALATIAQQTAEPGSSEKETHGIGMPGVQDHLRVLTEKLDLTEEQQAKTRPILQEMHDATEKFRQDKSISREELLTKVRACREKADKKLRKILSDEQKKRLDQLEHQPHPELHGDLSGASVRP